MAMEGTLKNRNGKLYVLYTSDEYSEPFRQHLWWRVLETRGTGYGERPEAGDIATSTGGGEWRTRNPSTHRSTGSVSTGTGSTQAELVERVSIPPPAAGGKELRWRDGRWEKLMAKGWMPAGEGKAKTSKKSSTSSTNHSTAKRQHSTKKSPAQLQREIDEALAARSGLSKHQQYLLSRRGPSGGLRAGYLTPAGWHGDPMTIEDRKLRLEALREQPAPRFPPERSGRTHATKKRTAKAKGRFWVAPAADPRDRYAAGYNGNHFRTRAEAQRAITSLRALGGEFDVPWIINED